MPTVVYHKPDAFTSAAQSVTGYLEGRIAGEQTRYDRGQAEAATAEDKRRFEVGTANAVASEKMQREQQLSTEALNEKFRRDNLAFLEREGLAERKLKQDLQTEDLSAQEKRLGMQLKQSEIENARDNRTRAYGIKKQAEADQSRLDLQRQELQSQQEKLDFAQTTIGKYGDPKVKPYTPEQWAQIKQEGRIRWLGSGAVSGQEDVVQATPEAIAQIDRMVESSIMGYSTLRSQVTADHIALADQMAQTEAKYKDQGGRQTRGDQGGFRLDQMYDPNEAAVDSLSGQRLLSDDFMRQLTMDQAEIASGIEAYINQVAVDSATMPNSDRLSVNDQAERHIKDLLGSPEFQSQHPQTIRSLTDYYTDRLATSMEAAANPPLPSGEP